MINSIDNVLDTIEETRHHTGYYKKLKLSLDYGSETQLHIVGDIVKHQHTTKPEFYYVAKIIEAYSENGFWYYVVENKEYHLTDSDSLVEIIKIPKPITIRTKDLL